MRMGRNHDFMEPGMPVANPDCSAFWLNGLCRDTLLLIELGAPITSERAQNASDQ